MIAVFLTVFMYTLRKSLGQHFLKDENISRKIVTVILERSFDRLLEVGPGGGALTKYLVQIPGIEFKAVELDNDKVEYLLKQYPILKGKIVHESFLDIQKPFQQSFTIAGNFPYNISSQILFKILEWTDSVECMVGMFQKEVAIRVAAKEGNKDYGILSVLIQAFFSVEYLFEVHENCFTPPPKVKSAVIRIVNKGNPYGIEDRKKFFGLVKTAFGQRRKQLRNPLKNLFPLELLQAEIFNKRAENLQVKDYVELMKKMK
jgi:16S rRNA (adenine1518-N6/adenine1519-N6)-dimethyltransferase